MSALSKIKAFFTPEWEPKGKLNQNGSRYLAFAQIALFFLGILFAHIILVPLTTAIIAESLLFVATLITAVGIGFHDTYPTSSNLKTAVQIASAISNAIVPFILRPYTF